MSERDAPPSQGAPSGQYTGPSGARPRRSRGYIRTSNPFKDCQAGCCRTGTAASCFRKLDCPCHPNHWRSYTRTTLTGDW